MRMSGLYFYKWRATACLLVGLLIERMFHAWILRLPLASARASSFAHSLRLELLLLGPLRSPSGIGSSATSVPCSASASGYASASCCLERVVEEDIGCLLLAEGWFADLLELPSLWLPLRLSLGGLILPEGS